MVTHWSQWMSFFPFPGAVKGCVLGTMATRAALHDVLTWSLGTHLIGFCASRQEQQQQKKSTLWSGALPSHHTKSLSKLYGFSPPRSFPRLLILLLRLGLCHTLPIPSARILYFDHDINRPGSMPTGTIRASEHAESGANPKQEAEPGRRMQTLKGQRTLACSTTLLPNESQTNKTAQPAETNLNESTHKYIDYMFACMTKGCGVETTISWVNER